MEHNSALPANQKPDLRTTSTARQFAINGPIEPSNRPAVYYVDVTAPNESLIRYFDLPGQYVLLHGPRGSGKTTRALAIKERTRHDKTFTCLYTSLQSVSLSHANTGQFWNEYGTHIHRMNYSPSDPPIYLESVSDFTAWLHDRSVFAGCKILLIVDELQRLHQASAVIRDQFLGALTCLKSQCGAGTTHLWGWLGLGPHSATTLRSRVPFNVSHAVQAPNFTESEVVTLLREYAAEHGLTAWDDRVARDIYLRTNGHAGLVCFCGQRIHETVPPLTSYHAWLQYASTSLTRVTRTDCATTRELVETVLTNTEAIAFLSQRLLHRPAPIQWSFHNGHVLEFLAAAGVLCKDGEISFRLVSPLIRTVLLSALPDAVPREGKDKADPIQLE